MYRYAGADALRPVRGDGARAESGQRSHGADVLLAKHATVQPGVGQGKITGPEGAEEHHEPHEQGPDADHADDAHVSQLVHGGPGERVADRGALRDVPGVVVALGRRARLNASGVRHMCTDADAARRSRCRRFYDITTVVRNTPREKKYQTVQVQQKKTHSNDRKTHDTRQQTGLSAAVYDTVCT